MADISWQGKQTLKSYSYNCGYCGKSLASEKGYEGSNSRGERAYIYICHNCNKPTLIDCEKIQTPAPLHGNNVENISDEGVRVLYEESRKSIGNGSYTASVLCCRKILMAIAVSKGAKTGESFKSYVQFICDNNYVPPDAKEWVDKIREKGNEANHEIAIMSEKDAKEIIDFVEMILKLVYEFPARSRK